MKNTKYITIGLVVLGIFGAGGYVANQKNTKEKEFRQEVATLLKNIESTFPPGFTHTNVFHNETSLFNNTTTGTYTLMYKDTEQPDLNGSYEVKYSVKHGMKEYFSNSYPFSGKAFLKGETFKKYNIDGESADINGVVEENGNFNININSLPIDTTITVENPQNRNLPSHTKASESVHLKVDAASGIIQYDKNKNLISLDYLYPLITMESKGGDYDDKIVIKDTNFKQESLLNNSNFNNISFELSVKELQNKLINISGFKINSKIKDENEKYSFINNIKIDKVAYNNTNVGMGLVPNEEFTFGLATSFNNIHKTSFNNLVDVIKKSKDMESLTPEDKKQATVEIINLLKHGLSFNVDHLLVKGKNLELEGETSIEMLPSVTVKDISFENNLNAKLLFKIVADPQTQQFIRPFLSGYQHPKTTDDTLYIEVTYKKDHFFVNLTDLTGSMEHEAIKSNLQNTDRELKVFIDKLK